MSEGNFFFNLALREKNIQVKLYLKVVLKSWDVDTLITRTNFQKRNLGWPQQPPTEKWYFMISLKKWFLKHQNKAKFKNFYDFWVLGSDFPGLRISVASMISTASVASMTSTASFHKKNTEFYVSINHVTKMTYPGFSMWNGTSKTHCFIDFWHLSS